MFYQKLQFKFDIEKLKKNLYDDVIPLGEPFYQGREYGYADAFGGWSLLSYSGHWRDGWEIGHVMNEEYRHLFYNKNNIPNYKAMKYINYANPMEHKVKTEACVGEISKAIDYIDSLGLTPRRARVTVLNPKTTGVHHADGSSDEYMARLHIPLVTNENCIHECEGQKLHMPADGSCYILWVNRYHNIFNDSDVKRYHIIMDVYDTKGVTEEFKFNGNIDDMQKVADEFRKNMDMTNLTSNDISFYNNLKQNILKELNI
jgi:hypothetical protein